jgi:glycosyltransferase involved in cell wall biosynthesis
MKIIVFTTYYPPSNVGGIPSHAHEFNKLLSNDGTDVTVFTTKIPCDAAESEKINGHLKIIRFPAFEIVPNFPLPRFWKYRFWSLYFGLFKNDYDIVISRIRFFSTSLLALFFSKYKKIKWVHIEHTSNFAILSSRVKTTIAKIYDCVIGNFILKKSDLNISISKAVQGFVSKFDTRFSPIIYRGLELSAIDAIKPDVLFKEKFKDKLIIITAARLYKWKGIENSIYAIKSLPKQIKENIVFCVIGAGEDFKRLRKKADDSIMMTGEMARNEVIGIMKVADIYIHSSLPGGGLSTSLLEAMYCKCAVIATANEGADEIVINNQSGILIDEPYDKSIRDSIVFLANNKLSRENYSKEARIAITNKFDWSDSIKKYKQILEQLLEKPR